MTSDVKMDIEALAEVQPGNTGLFEFQPGNSFLHRMNPVTKVVLIASLVTVALLAPSYRVPTIFFIGAIVATIIAGIFGRVARILGGLAMPLAFSLLFFHGLFNPANETVLWEFEGLPVVETVIVWQEGIQFALTILTPLLVLMVCTLATVMTTHPKKIAIAMVQKGLSPRLAYVFMAALQFIPDMREQAYNIIDAQQARGLDVKGSIRRRIRAFVDLLAPLLIGMLITTETRSLALDSRGFTKTNTRSYLFDVPDRPIDRVLRWLGGAAVLVAIGWWVVQWL